MRQASLSPRRGNLEGLVQPSKYFKAGGVFHFSVFGVLRRPMRSGRVKFKILVCLVLALATVAGYWPVRTYDFVNYDDSLYLTSNPQVVSGLTWENVRWAFRSHSNDYWRPLTWLVFMLDFQLFGLNAGAHHLSNVVFHLAAALLLFLVFHRMTRAPWHSAWIAGLFACHPLQVQSVAWVAERGESLSACFWLLTLWAYVRYAQGSVRCQVSGVRTDTTRNTQHAVFHPPSAIFYLLSLFSFALGLLSKPTLVTLPFVLLLLDYWPLGRFQLSTFNFQLSTLRRLLLEKLPFLALSGISCVITFLGQQHMGNVASVESLPLGLRLGNALISYVRYLGKTFWPSHLTFFYPHPGRWPAWQLVGAGLIILGVSLLALRTARRRPYLLVGWLWFLGMLLPVIGLIQVGAQSMADRYAYLPLIGLFIMLAWGTAEILTRWRHGPVLLGLLAVASFLGCVVVTSVQLRYWRNSETLFRHAIEVTEGNYVAWSLLGVELDGQGKSDQAIGCYTEALRFNPGYAEAHYHLGLLLERQGNVEEALTHYTAAVRCNPRFAEAHNNLGILLKRQGKLDQALGAFTEALRINPANAEAHYNLGLVFAMNGQPAEAVARYREAIRLRPDYAKAFNNLAWLRATCRDPKVRDGAEAVRLAKRALELPSDNSAESLDTLAAAYAEAGRFAEAVKVARRALELAETIGQKELAAQIRRRLTDYEVGKPYQE